MNPRTKISPLLFALLVLPLISSCASLKMLPAEKPKSDPFSRVYPVPFKDFHPRLNQALQKFAQEKPGNSFQVARLGSDMVIIRGFYRKELNQARFPVAITTKPLGAAKTRMEIKPSPSQWGVAEDAAGELFQIFEKETGFTPVE